MNEGDGESCANHYKINARDFFVPTQVMLHSILRLCAYLFMS